jgi:hypothetical protein
VGGEARGFDPRISAPLTTIATNAPPPWDMARCGELILKVAEIWGISEGAWPIARVSLKHCFFIIEMRHGHEYRGGGSFDAGRDKHVDRGGSTQ